MIETKVTKEGVVFSVKGSIVATVSKALKEELLSKLKEKHPGYIIDFKDVESIDSSGVGVLIAAQNDLKKNNGQLSVINVSSSINKMFKIMRLDKHFNVQVRPEDSQ